MRTFIVETNTGYVIGASDNTTLPTDSNGARTLATHVSDPIIRDIAAAVQAKANAEAEAAAAERAKANAEAEATAAVAAKAKAKEEELKPKEQLDVKSDVVEAANAVEVMDEVDESQAPTLSKAQKKRAKVSN